MDNTKWVLNKFNETLTVTIKIEVNAWTSKWSEIEFLKRETSPVMHSSPAMRINFQSNVAIRTHSRPPKKKNVTTELKHRFIIKESYQSRVLIVKLEPFMQNKTMFNITEYMS